MQISQGTIHIDAFKDGLLSRLGHDIRLRVQRFRIEVDDQRVEARFETNSIEMVSALREGRPGPGLSSKDCREIERTLASKVLNTRAIPEAIFRGVLEQDGARIRLVGSLDLAGRKQPLTVDAERSDGLIRGDVELAPSRWGIRPYKALMGALRMQDRVILRFEFPDLAQPK